jgi:N4-gp56 family major capsid protein
MATTSTAALSSEVQTVYDADFWIESQKHLYYDQLAATRVELGGQKGNVYQFPIVASNQPATGALDELTDVVPQQLRANFIQIQLFEYGDAVEVTRFLAATAYPDVYQQAAQINGYSMAESLDRIARNTLGQGGIQMFQNNQTARSGFGGINTAADRLNGTFLERLSILMARSMGIPMFDDGTLVAAMHPVPYYDLLQQNSNARDMSVRVTPEMLLNGELAYWAGMRIIVSGAAKGFWGAGANHPTASLNTTLAAPAAIGDTNLKLTSTTGAAAGMWFAIQDATEPGNTWCDTNEMLMCTLAGTAGPAGYGLDFVVMDPGPGDSGGLRYSHAPGVTVTNKNSVYPVNVVGPMSLLKIASDETGPYGETVVTGPFDRLGRFLTFGWYAILGYARSRTRWNLRGEVGGSI